MNDRETFDRIKRVLKGQDLAVLSTIGKRYPYQNIVSFSVSRDFKHIFFATSRATVKYANIKRCPRVSMFVDNRTNSELDLLEAVGVTAIGDAQEVRSGALKLKLSSYIRRHPHLKGFADSPGVSLFSIRVRAYFVVTRFQEVSEVKF